MVEDEAGIIATGRRAQGALLPDVNAINLRRMPRYLADTVAAVSGYAVAEAFLAVADCDYALGVAIPGEVVYAASYYMIFA